MLKILLMPNRFPHSSNSSTTSPPQVEPKFEPTHDIVIVAEYVKEAKGLISYSHFFTLFVNLILFF